MTLKKQDGDLTYLLSQIEQSYEDDPESRRVSSEWSINREYKLSVRLDDVNHFLLGVAQEEVDVINKLATSNLWKMHNETSAKYSCYSFCQGLPHSSTTRISTGPYQ